MSHPNPDPLWPSDSCAVGEWRIRFAWLPTWTDDYGRVWLRHVMRRRCLPRPNFQYFCDGRWQHRLASLDDVRAAKRDVYQTPIRLGQ